MNAKIPTPFIRLRTASALACGPMSSLLVHSLGEFKGLKALALEDYVEGEVEIVSLETSPKGKGIGTQVMKQLVETADRHEVNLMLIPAGNQSKRDRLGAFYERFGFEWDGDLIEMRGKPRPSDLSRSDI